MVDFYKELLREKCCNEAREDDDLLREFLNVDLEVDTDSVGEAESSDVTSRAKSFFASHAKNWLRSPRTAWVTTAVLLIGLGLLQIRNNHLKKTLAVASIEKTAYQNRGNFLSIIAGSKVDSFATTNKHLQNHLAAFPQDSSSLVLCAIRMISSVDKLTPEVELFIEDWQSEVDKVDRTLQVVWFAKVSSLHSIDGNDKVGVEYAIRGVRKMQTMHPDRWNSSFLVNTLYRLRELGRFEEIVEITDPLLLDMNYWVQKESIKCLIPRISALRNFDRIDECKPIVDFLISATTQASFSDNDKVTTWNTAAFFYSDTKQPDKFRDAIAKATFFNAVLPRNEQRLNQIYINSALATDAIARGDVAVLLDATQDSEKLIRSMPDEQTSAAVAKLTWARIEALIASNRLDEALALDRKQLPFLKQAQLLTAPTAGAIRAKLFYISGNSKMGIQVAEETLRNFSPDGSRVSKNQMAQLQFFKGGCEGTIGSYSNAASSFGIAEQYAFSEKMRFECKFNKAVCMSQLDSQKDEGVRMIAALIEKLPLKEKDAARKNAENGRFVASFTASLRESLL